MADDVLKAYGERRNLDDLIDILLIDPELGFNPFFWITRQAIIEASENPQIQASYKKYREAMKKIYTEEMLKGQAFGL
jgi:hypothetical protein